MQSGWMLPLTSGACRLGAQGAMLAVLAKVALLCKCKRKKSSKLQGYQTSKSRERTLYEWHQKWQLKIFFFSVCVWVFCFHKAVGYLILFWAFPLRVSFPLENASRGCLILEDEIFEMWTPGCLQLHSSSHVSCGILSCGDHKPLSQLEWDRD